ncbi:TauD/TfdA family dioxygenase [Phenylobacterium sp. LjRoot225]|uniref:TauD/TfdA dioxygenase family protein n=1 Tax=Phenylobacterium sp. LjRoot225 TaxID=3342285 RepID=UPI003ECC83C5
MSAAVREKTPEQQIADLEIRPLQPTLGAEISGVDLSRPISDATRDAIKAAVLKHKVVFFRDQALTDDQQADFAARFGPLYTHPSAKRHDNIAPLHRIAAADFNARELVPDPTSVESGYHTDTSWRLVPTWGAVLRAVSVPEIGGDTIWVDANLAYQGLPDALKARLEDLHVTHDFRHALEPLGHDYPIVSHRVVRTHRETGQKILWVNFTQRPHILGLDIAESKELLQTILYHYKKPENQVRFSWRPGSVAFWDNRAAVHYAVRNYGDFPRLMQRVLIADEPLYADL